MSAGESNPILSIEEFRRFPLRPRRRARLGAVHVYRSAGGDLYCPPGGLTTGELWYRAPREVYEVDVLEHPFELSCELSTRPGDAHIHVNVAGRWYVTSPEKIVAGRIFDVSSIAYPAVVSAVQDFVLRADRAAARDRSTAAREGDLPSIDRPEGFRIDVESLTMQDTIEPASAGRID
jgi:hypothetical protein